MLRVTDVVKHLIGINVIVFIAVNLLPFPGIRQYFVLYHPSSDAFRPIQLFTHMFMHGGVQHIFFNMLMLYFLGPQVERHLGEKKFLLLYIFSGIGALLVHLLLVPYGSMVGASGAIYGVMAGFAFLFPNTQLMLLFPPIPVKAKYLVVGIIAIDLFSGISATQSGIAHFAHLGGAIFGVLLLLFWRKFGK
ncbi:MAG: rhomboid family intramembrane serine protease [Saprospiraceae bacterium]